MEPFPVGLDQNLSGAGDDFPALLRRKGLVGPAAAVDPTMRATMSSQQTWVAHGSDHDFGV